MVINICLFTVIILISIVLISYNRFIRLNNKVKESESKIDVLLNQRFDLIPNLVECVKGYSKYESETLEDLTELRSSYKNTDFSVNENEKIDRKFNQIFALAENYPDLKSNEQFISLQNSLYKIENELIQARIGYNNSVTRFNNHVETIPSNIIAKIFAFEKKELFTIDESKKENIKMDFSK